MTSNFKPLRTDGLYVQIGNRIWESDFFKTNKCWYNLMKITENNKAIMLGSSGYNTFFEIYDDMGIPIEKKYCLEIEDRSEGAIYELYGDFEDEYHYDNFENNLVEYSKHNFTNRLDDPFIPKLFHGYINGQSFRDIDLIPADTILQIKKDTPIYKPFYNMFGLEKQSKDILDVVKYFKNFNWDKFNNMPYHRGIEIWDILQYDNTDDDFSEDSWESVSSREENAKWFAQAKHTYCNDNIYMTYIDNPYVIYLWGSLNFSEFIDDEESKYNTFGFYFIPFDLSKEKVWKVEYTKWKNRYVKSLRKK